MGIAIALHNPLHWHVLSCETPPYSYDMYCLWLTIYIHCITSCNVFSRTRLLLHRNRSGAVWLPWEVLLCDSLDLFLKRWSRQARVRLVKWIHNSLDICFISLGKEGFCGSFVNALVVKKHELDVCRGVRGRIFADDVCVSAPEGRNTATNSQTMHSYLRTRSSDKGGNVPVLELVHNL